MGAPSDAVIDRVKVREVAGVFRSRDTLEAAVKALLLEGFDRGDIDLMASVEAIREKLGTAYVPAEELADVGSVPRRAFVASEDETLVMAGAAGILTYIGATTAALGVVASGGALALAAVAAAIAGGAGGGIGAFLMGRFLGKKRAEELEAQMAAGGLVLWIRVRSPEQEEKSQKVLRDHGAEAVRVHEIELEKRVTDIPLSGLRPDPWLGSEHLGQV
jgi:hypothetical protein